MTEYPYDLNTLKPFSYTLVSFIVESAQAEEQIELSLFGGGGKDIYVLGAWEQFRRENKHAGCSSRLPWLDEQSPPSLLDTR